MRPGQWGARRGLIHLAKLWRGLAAPECVVGPALAQGNRDKLMLEKTKNVPKVAGETVPVVEEGETSLTAFQEGDIAFRVGATGWEVL